MGEDMDFGANGMTKPDVYVGGSGVLYYFKDTENPIGLVIKNVSFKRVLGQRGEDVETVQKISTFEKPTELRQLEERIRKEIKAGRLRKLVSGDIEIDEWKIARLYHAAIAMDKSEIIEAVNDLLITEQLGEDNRDLWDL